MATLAPGGRITIDIVDDEIERLKQNWGETKLPESTNQINHLIKHPLDLFDQIQLEKVIKVCQNAASAAEAGRVLFNVSRLNKTSNNDSHRLTQFLKKFGLSFDEAKNSLRVTTYQ